MLRTNQDDSFQWLLNLPLIQYHLIITFLAGTRDRFIQSRDHHVNGRYHTKPLIKCCMRECFFLPFVSDMAPIVYFPLSV